MIALIAFMCWLIAGPLAIVMMKDEEVSNNTKAFLYSICWFVLMLNLLINLHK